MAHFFTNVWTGCKTAFFWFFGSFDAKDQGGASARKLTAFALMFCVFELHQSDKITEKNVENMLFWDLLTILLLLGIVTVAQLWKWKMGGSSDNNKPVEKQP